MVVLVDDAQASAMQLAGTYERALKKGKVKTKKSYRIEEL